jgi:two-component system, NarL family, response regulator NreC
VAVTVVLVDDHLLVRQGVRALLEREHITVLGEGSDGLEGIRLAQEHQPDVVVMALAMPAMNGITAAAEIKKVSPRTKVVLLTMHSEEHHILQALRAGITAVVAQTQAAAQLLQAIRDVCAGGMYMNPNASDALVQACLSNSELPADPLSGREHQVLQLVAEGKTSKEVAVILGITVKTAEAHRTRLMAKLDIHSTAGLVRYAVRRGVVEP